MTTSQFIASGKRAIALEIEAMTALTDRIDHTFEQACHLILNIKGKVIVTGMGKSGHIGNKIAASLASTGTPAFFVHPTEAIHGDLGMIAEQDLVIAISNSGSNSEILQLLPSLKRQGIDIIAMTGNKKSQLAQHSAVILDTSVAQEACPLDLAPTSSTTATLLIGDAIVVALLDARGFTAEDFALSHPGGKLGKSLLTRIEDIMQTGELVPQVLSGTTLSDTLDEMTKKTLGMTAITNQQGELIGIFTDGDLRRALLKNIRFTDEIVDQHMTKKPKVIQSGMLVTSALKFMQDNNINGLFVLDENKRPVGAFNMLSVLNAGLA